VKGIPVPATAPPVAATAGVTADVPAGIPLAIASNLGRSGGDAIVVSGRSSTTHRRGDTCRPELTIQQTIGEPAARYGRGNVRNPLLLHKNF